MANTFSINTQGVTWAADKNMLALQNHTGSGVVLSVFRIWLFNPQTSALTASTCKIQLWSYTSVSSFTGGSAQTFVKHDTNYSNLPSQVSANSGTTTVLTKNVLLRQIIRHAEEAAVGTGGKGELETGFPPLNMIWDSGYSDSVLQPLTLREGQGLVLYTPSSGGGTYQGSTDICVEFTSA